MKQRKPRIVFRISQSSIYKQIAYNDYIGRNAADVEVIIYNMDAQNQKSVLSIYKSWGSTFKHCIASKVLQDKRGFT